MNGTTIQVTHQIGHIARPRFIGSFTFGDGCIGSTQAKRLPVHGGDLVAAGLSCREIGKVLDLLDQRWQDSGCRLSKDQLLASLYAED